ncbi:hypothetical protein JW868_00460 [Candidatus Woesearchaeota archaeon]|nr:hypothetical protein [Candidatus Woesearchaeota archaeon]
MAYDLIVLQDMADIEAYASASLDAAKDMLRMRGHGLTGFEELLIHRALNLGMGKGFFVKYFSQRITPDIIGRELRDEFPAGPNLAALLEQAAEEGRHGALLTHSAIREPVEGLMRDIFTSIDVYCLD